MMDVTLTAANIESWSNLGVDLPKGLTEALAAFDAARYVEAPAPLVNADKLNAKNVGQTVQAVTDELVKAEKHAEAVRTVRNSLARRVLREAGAAVPSILEDLTPRFDAAVEKLKEAVAGMPEYPTSDNLVKAGPDALQAYVEAKEAAAVIHGVDAWVTSLSQLPAYGGRRPFAPLRIFKPKSPAEYRKLVRAHEDRHGVDPSIRDLGPVLLDGVRAGIDTEIHDPIEADRIEKSLQAAAAEAEKGYRFT